MGTAKAKAAARPEAIYLGKFSFTSACHPKWAALRHVLKGARFFGHPSSLTPQVAQFYGLRLGWVPGSPSGIKLPLI